MGYREPFIIGRGFSITKVGIYLGRGTTQTFEFVLVGTLAARNLRISFPFFHSTSRLFCFSTFTSSLHCFTTASSSVHLPSMPSLASILSFAAIISTGFAQLLADGTYIQYGAINPNLMWQASGQLSKGRCPFTVKISDCYISFVFSNYPLCP